MNLKTLFFPVAMIFSFFFSIYFIKPAWSGYSYSKGELLKGTADLEELRGHKNSLDQALTAYNEIVAEDRVLINNSMPDAIDEENFLKELSDAAFESEADVYELKSTKVEHKNLEDTSNVRKINIVVSSKGSYFSFKKMVYLIENMNRFVKINKFSIAQDQEDPDFLVFDFDLDFFYEKDPSKLKIDLSDSYFSSLLREGLNKDAVENYKKYREQTINFDSIEIGNSGREDLFDFGVSGAIEQPEEPLATE